MFRNETATLFSKAMAQTRMAVILADPHLEDCPIVFANTSFIELTGYPADEVLGRNCRFLQGPKTDPGTVAKMRDALQSEDVVVVEVLNYRKNGEPFWNALHLGPIYDEDGILQYYFGSQWNVSDIHTARENEEHAKVMARELSHRVKNMFSIVSAVVSMTADRHDVPHVADDINDRIFALGRAYEITLQHSSHQMVDLEPLVRSVLGAYSTSTDQRIELTGAKTSVQVSQSATIGLVLHELATNAVKYGAFSSPRGVIVFEWTVSEGDEPVLEMHWTEHTESPVAAPIRVGTGSGIIQSVLEASDGAIERTWHASGLKAVIRLPL
ncbi:PAS domain-containing protein [Palleronia aestuarii]|nr:PAS domain-containing protein [Palleronia aestuarii]